jgi:hypothetical protein
VSPNWSGALVKARVPAQVVANQSRLARESSSLRATTTQSAAPHFTYSPVIHVPPGSPKETVDAVTSALSGNRSELQRLVAELYQAEHDQQSRKGFGR